MGELTVLRAGPLTSVQDLGRTGHRALGVSRGGALDPLAAQVANLLVGNEPEAALLEVTLGGVKLCFADERAIAWAGGDFPVRIAQTTVPAGRRVIVKPDEELEIGPARAGIRMWLAIAGGVDVPLVLGSRATDVRAAFGGHEGRALRDGDLLSLGRTAFSPGRERISNWSAPADWTETTAGSPILRVLRGSEWDEFTSDARKTFLETSFQVRPQADRMGARLEGLELRRRKKRELISEAVAPGTVQVANDGQPIVLLGDCQTIGGYPKIAHVITVDLGRAAQLQPNDSVVFSEMTLAEARALFAARARDLQLFRVALRLRER